MPGDNGGAARYVCQATRLPYATTNLAWWDIRQYLEDYSSGNVGLWRMARGFVYSIYFSLTQAGIGIGPAMRWFYNKFHFLWRGSFPATNGDHSQGQPTPAAVLNLQPGS